MKIMVFLHGTLIMHKSGANVSREERVKQSASGTPDVSNFKEYIPIGNPVKKLNEWVSQGTEVVYLSSNTDKNELANDQFVLDKYGFPAGKLVSRQIGQNYGTVAEIEKPDILIEDDCESIGGYSEMTITQIQPEMKSVIKSIVLKEFCGIDSLPDSVNDLMIF